MTSKNIMIEKSVFENLRQFRDENYLPSYTEAIKYLIAFFKYAVGPMFEWRWPFNVGEFVGEIGVTNQESYVSTIEVK